MTLDIRKQSDFITLGETVLPVTDYCLKTEVPVVRRTFCDGAHGITLLDALPCTLTCSGSLLLADAARRIAALQPDMQAHTPFSFDFTGLHFSDMRIVSAECTVKQAAHTALFTISMTGVYAA